MASFALLRAAVFGRSLTCASVAAVAAVSFGDAQGQHGSDRTVGSLTQVPRHRAVPPPPAPPPPPPPSPMPHTPWMSRHAIADAVEIASPAVVHITAAGIVASLGPFVRRGESSGSGFIIESTDTECTVITNAHVVAMARGGVSRNLTVSTSDGRTFPARVQAVDDLSDICVLKVKTDERLPCARLGSSSSLRPGDWLVVCGSPLSLRNSVTFGVVSNIGRPGQELGLATSARTLQYLQTDASVQEGNSGGPFINLDGEVVAIAVMKVADVEGISFGIPIDYAKTIITQLRANGFVKRPHLGLQIVAVTPPMLQAVKARDPTAPLPQGVNGLLVVDLEQGAGYRAGLRPLDVITHVNDAPVRTVDEFLDVFEDDFEQGVLLTVVRGTGRQPLRLHLVPDMERPHVQR
eukprot:m.138830 g.138830  ORF g.138830 m.138830 type:complete len:407 (+) comp17039_c0_seq7:262-1482(+)